MKKGALNAHPATKFLSKLAITQRCGVKNSSLENLIFSKDLIAGLRCGAQKSTVFATT